MDEFLASSDLCEENGLQAAAELLRRVSASGGNVFLVVERGWEYNDEIDVPNPVGQPRSIYLDREAAEMQAAQRNRQILRENNIMTFCYSLEDVSDHSAQELSARMSAILGRDYHFPGSHDSDDDDEEDVYEYDSPTIPGGANEDQAQAIADLFTLKFAYVIETQIED